MTPDDTHSPPPGYRASEPRGPFSRVSGPFYDRPVETGAARGFRVLPQHCNALGIAHGGLLLTFADELLARAATRATDARALTFRLQADFVSMAREGDWIDGVAYVTRLTEKEAFVEGRLIAGERTVLCASGVFKLMQGRKIRAAQRRSDTSSEDSV